MATVQRAVVTLPADVLVERPKHPCPSCGAMTQGSRVYCSDACREKSWPTWKQGARARATNTERFQAKVQKADGDACWEWLGSRHPKGYGIFRWRGEDGKYQNGPAHRAALMLATGPRRSSVLACHRCDNRGCVRFDHLFWGSAADNAADRDSKGRGAAGDRHGRVILTDAQVEQIRDRYKNEIAGQLAHEFGVSINTIYGITAGRSRRPPQPSKPVRTTLPPDCVVERRGIGEDRHVLLDIEGTSFELRADEAHALGVTLIHCAEDVAGDDGGGA